MIVESEAIVLRARKQGETSKIVTLYTRAFGKVNVIAKGARELKSKFGGALEMFARANVVFYKKERPEAGLYLLSKADLQDSNGPILKNLDKIESATAMIELVLRAMHDEEEHPEVFDLLSSALAELSRSDENPLIAQFRFNLAFLRIMGFELGAEAARSLSAAANEFFRNILEGARPNLPAGLENELQSFFRAYFAEHLSGMNPRSMRSGAVFSRM